MAEDTTRIDPDAMYNPSSGMLTKNPTHMEVAKTADDQQEIVNSIRDMRVKHMKAIYDYTDFDPNNPSPIPGLPGVLKLREMGDEDMAGFCRTLMRTKPLITRIYLKYGDYDFKREYRGGKIQRLQAHKPRHPTEIATLIADILGDKSLNIIEFEYKVNSAGAGNFQSKGIAYGTKDSDYRDNSLFKPYLEIEYVAI
jgi:hypothetical protein